MRTILRLLFVCFALGPARAGAQAPAGPAGTGAPQALSGGFQVGDRILLRVEGDSQFTGQFTGTFAVGPGPALALPVIGAIPLIGVRRSEVEAYLGRELARYLRNPAVHAKALIRLSIMGEVEHPGFYSVPADAVFADALMQAGGPTRDAKPSGINIERDGKPLLQGDSLELAVAHGLTVDQMGLRDGDRFVVPRTVPRDSERTLRILGLLVTLPAAIYGITRIW